MELPKLVLFQNRLLSLEDQKGLVSEVLKKDKGHDSFVVSRSVIAKGKDETDKSIESECASEKDDELDMGSTGKECIERNRNVSQPQHAVDIHHQHARPGAEGGLDQLT